MTVDLHIHTNRSSYCSLLHQQEMIDCARRLGIDAVAVTEHSVTRGAQIAYEMGLEQGFTVFRGIEVYTAMGDIIVFGLGGNAHHDADFIEIMDEVRRKDAVAIAADPTRGHWGHHRKYKGLYPDEVFELVGAVETHNGQNPRYANVSAAVLREALSMTGTGGSDAHQQAHVGRCVTVFERSFSTEPELIEELRAGRCFGAYLGELEMERKVAGD